MPNSRKVLLVGWDAADWKIINDLMDRGLMPHTQKLVEGGTMGNLRTLSPVSVSYTHLTLPTILLV